MSFWIKICANTTLEDARLAVEAGADAVGFVFAPSPRRVTREQVAAITPHLPAEVEKIGVFVDAEADAIAETVRQAGLTGVQLHSWGSGGAAERLREQCGPSLRILQVVHFGEHATEELSAASADGFLDGVLVDSRTAAAVGGTGVSFDWEAARETVFTPKRGLRLIVAGGLTAGNVGEAIRLLRPWGVDVASGVEMSPGRKDAAKVREFVERARQAAGQIVS